MAGGIFRRVWWPLYARPRLFAPPIAPAATTTPSARPIGAGFDDSPAIFRKPWSVAYAINGWARRLSLAGGVTPPPPATAVPAFFWFLE